MFWQSWTRTEGSSLSRRTSAPRSWKGAPAVDCHASSTQTLSVWAGAGEPMPMHQRTAWNCTNSHSQLQPDIQYWTKTPDLLKLCQINKVYGLEVKGQRTVEYYMQYGTLCNMVLMLQWRKCSEGSLELLHCACIWSRQILFICSS